MILLLLPALTITTAALRIGTNLALLQIDTFLRLSVDFAAILGPCCELLCVTVCAADALLF